MILTLIWILLAFWLLGLVFKIGGKLIHLLLIGALVVFILHLIGILI